MQTSMRPSPQEAALPLILLAAVIQGWALYALHHAVIYNHWPATDEALLVPLYALALFVPVSIQLMAAHARAPMLWRFIITLSVGFFYFGWHYGAHISARASEQGFDGYVSTALMFGIVWLLTLPFVQTRLTTGSWAGDYRALFTHAWRNKLMLAEAALFTGLFWLLLFLWQMLFHLLRIDYFRELFEQPIFIYPVTALTFGCAMHLIGSITQLTSIVLEQLLNVLKWLATLAALILGLFSLALMLNIPSLVFTGQRAIGATWLLWLLAVMVLLLNAAYRDGSVPQPYPKWISQCLRFVVPLMVIVALTALYALIVRSRHYGLTVERFWAFIVAGAALLYSVGYSIAAFKRGAWLAAIGRVNVAVAVALIVIVSAALTPALSPYRLAANSQFRLVQEKGLAALQADDNNRMRRIVYQQNSPLHYLRFDTGSYGRIKLKELAERYNGADMQEVRRLSAAMLKGKNRWEAHAQLDVPDLVRRLAVYPAGRSLDQALTARLVEDLNKPENISYDQSSRCENAAGIYIDLNNDGIDEFVYLTPFRGRAYANRSGTWVFLGDVSLRSDDPSNFAFSCEKRNLIDELAKGNLSAQPSSWSDLIVGSHRYRLNATE
jgi:hypothetical protein